MTRFVIPLFVLAGMLVTVASHAQNDQVFGSSGAPTRGTIDFISPNQVKVQSAGATLTFEVKDILKVTFGDEPSELRTARDRALAGQYEDAIEELKKVNLDEIGVSVIRQDVGYYAAYCTAQLALTAGGDKAAAINLLRSWLGQNLTSFHFFEGAAQLGDLYFASSDFTNAATFYGLLAKASWPEYKMKASVLQARALSAAGKDTEALALYEQVLSSGLNTPDAVQQKMHATVGKAICLAATGKADEGIGMIEDLIAKNDPSDIVLFGRAYNALGACYEKTGNAQDALLAYLHTDVLFFADTEAHAEALYRLSRLWADVGKSDRSVQARGLLQSRYPGSRWAGM